MLLQRTEKARLELKPGIRTLSLKERSILLLADGQKSLRDLHPLFNGEVEPIVLNLVRTGYLEQVAARAAPVSSPAAESASPPLRVAADQFGGRRSLATTRMFLFDLCERMFVRHDPQLAARFHDALREATERATMLAVARAMIGEIERVAGAERADSISQRIALLLPPETV